jgi:ketosteroid isomerase-like protein
MDRASVEAWVERYEQVWRTAGTDGLADLFSSDATYLTSPWATPVAGLEQLAELWEAERDGPDETFTMRSEVVAVDGDTAVVRLAVDYGDPLRSRWLDLWVIRFDGDGRCRAFEEWPFAPDRPDGH